MIKPVSTLSIIVAGVMCIVPTFGAQMTPQIQRLLDQKQEKIKKLEECEGKKQGWMIAGISTIGVTAVGVGVNIAQASKRNRLDDEIDTARHDLEVQERHLGEINSQIAEKERERAAAEKEKAERERAEQVAREQAEREKSGVDGVIGKECNDGKGLWFTAIEGNDKKCSDLTGAIVDCKCIEMTNFTPGSGQGAGAENNPAEKPKASETGGGEKSDKPGDDEKPKQESSLQKCLRERKDDRVGTACCYLSRSVATYEKGACVCVGKGKTFEIDKNGHGLCIDVQPDVVEPERILNMPCVEDDLQHPAKTGVYVNNGKLLCKYLSGVNVATYPCSCKITSCSDGFHVSNKNNGCEDNCPGNNQKWDKSIQKCIDVSCVLGANRIGDSACKCMDGLKREELADGRVKCIDEFEEGPGRNIPFRPFE